LEEREGREDRKEGAAEMLVVVDAE